VNPDITGHCAKHDRLGDVVLCGPSARYRWQGIGANVGQNMVLGMDDAFSIAGV